jgi:hypothetical protein
MHYNQVPTDKVFLMIKGRGMSFKDIALNILNSGKKIVSDNIHYLNPKYTISQFTSNIDYAPSERFEDGTNQNDILKTLPDWFMKPYNKETNELFKKALIDSIIKLRAENLKITEDNWEEIANKVANENRALIIILDNALTESEKKEAQNKNLSKDEQKKLAYKIFGSKLNELLNPSTFSSIKSSISSISTSFGKKSESTQDDILKTLPTWFIKPYDSITKDATNDEKKQILDSIVKLRGENININEDNMNEVFNKIASQNRILFIIIYSSITDAERKEIQKKTEGKKLTRMEEEKLYYPILFRNINELFNPSTFSSMKSSFFEGPEDVAGETKNERIIRLTIYWTIRFIYFSFGLLLASLVANHLIMNPVIIRVVIFLFTLFSVFVNPLAYFAVTIYYIFFALSRYYYNTTQKSADTKKPLIPYLFAMLPISTTIPTSSFLYVLSYPFTYELPSEVDPLQREYQYHLQSIRESYIDFKEDEGIGQLKSIFNELKEKLGIMHSYYKMDVNTGKRMIKPGTGQVIEDPKTGQKSIKPGTGEYLLINPFSPEAMQDKQEKENAAKKAEEEKKKKEQEKAPSQPPASNSIKTEEK